MNKIHVNGTVKTAVRIIATGTMASALALGPAGLALAANATPSAGTQTGSGDTDVYVQLKDIGEHSGWKDPTNPDEDGDDLGDQIAFTVPSEINFVADADGTLTGPDADKTYIENESAFGIHGSSLKVEAQNGWTLVAKNGTPSAANSIAFQVGPDGDMLDAAAYTEKAAMGDKSKWQMAAGADTGTADRVQMKSAGKVSNVSQDITTKKKVAVMHWYVTPGPAPSA